MTKKSAARIARDKEARSSGGKKSFDRERMSRCWYELKQVHVRAQKYIEKTALLFCQYANTEVHEQIVKNGKGELFNSLQAKIPPIMVGFHERFEELWNSHKDKKKLCLSYNELTEAVRIFEAYNAFNMDFYLSFSEIIEDINEIYNEAVADIQGIPRENGEVIDNAVSLQNPEEEETIKIAPVFNETN